MARTFQLVSVPAEERGLSLPEALAPYARLCAFHYRQNFCVAVDGTLYRLSVTTAYSRPKRDQRVRVEVAGDSQAVREWASEFDALFAPEWEAGAEEICDKYVPEGSVLYIPTTLEGDERYRDSWALSEQVRSLDAATAYYLNSDWIANVWRFPEPAKLWFYEHRWAFRADYTGVGYGQPPRRANEVTTVHLDFPEGESVSHDLRQRERWA